MKVREGQQGLALWRARIPERVECALWMAPPPRNLAGTHLNLPTVGKFVHAGLIRSVHVNSFDLHGSSRFDGLRQMTRRFLPSRAPY